MIILFPDFLYKDADFLLRLTLSAKMIVVFTSTRWALSPVINGDIDPINGLINRWVFTGATVFFSV